MSQIYTVRDLTDHVRRSLEGSFPFVWVKGEVSNLSRPSSGHVYFSLKDADALLNCVWFRGQQRGEERFDPLTGEVFEGGPRPNLALSMENGQQIMCAGSITVYAPRGVYQLLVELAQDAGLGQLYAAFEALKTRLAARGFFALERKRPLPCNPQRLAIITAPTGAVIHDFLRIAATRGSGAELRLHPVPVQGPGAASAIAQALAEVNSQAWAEAIVLIRGGGSLEDLWAFNEEAVAEAVHASTLPVIAGIGHEMDVSMADMIADVRAATPSHAAQLLWPAREEMMQRVDMLESALRTAAKRLLDGRCHSLAQGEKALAWLSPTRALERLAERFTSLGARLERAMEQRMAQKCLTLDGPLDRLNRAITPVLDAQARRLVEPGRRLAQSMDRRLHALEVLLEQCSVRLDAACPLAPLERGYAMVRHASGIVRSVQGVALGDAVEILLCDGLLNANICSITNKKNA